MVHLRRRAHALFRSAVDSAKSGAFPVVLLSLVILGVAGSATWHWWCYLVRDDTPTDVMRNVALVAGALIAWVFAFWRGSIAEKQADIAKQEHHHGRFQRAAELLAQQGIDNSHARISGLHAFRYVVYDAPGLGLEAIEIVTTLMIQTPVDEHHDVKEFTVAKATANYICDTIEASGMFDPTSREQLREDVAHACGIVEQKLITAGVNPDLLG